MRRPLLLVIVGGFILGALLGAGILIFNTDMRGNRVTTSGKALVGGPFALTGKAGKTVTDQDFRGRYMLVFFGFTHCPDICPTTLARLSQAVGKLPENERERVTIMFVSVDPNRDTPEQIAAYTRFYGDRIAGVTGSEPQLRQLVKRYRTTFGYDEPDENNNYNVSHSAGVYVFDTRGKARLLLRPDLTVAQIRDDISALAQERRS